ncbi:MAG: substrate-binding domain-containing protein [Planctomycetota bacterium]|nr:substrate-binding domain-containing protein [Planctomycetota bacterium]
MKRNAPAASRLRHRPQALKAYKRILQYIRANGLEQGDRLPIQPALRKALGLCGSTHGAAMEALLDDGVLVARQKVGTLVADMGAIERVPWTIGIVAIPIEWQAASTFTSDLFARLQAALSRAGCGCVSYHNQGPWPSPHEEYGALESDLAHGELDGLLAMTDLSAADWRKALDRGVPPCHTHWNEQTPCGALVDQSWAGDAVRLLAGRGCKRLAAGSNSERGSKNNRFWRAFDKGVREAGLSPDACATLDLDSKSGFNIERAALEQAQRLIRLPARKRPDGLIITDDGFAARLAMILREAGDYRPLMAVQTNRQHPQMFLLPIFAYEVDIQELAQQAAGLLLERVRNPATPERIVWHVPQRAQAEARSSLMSLVGEPGATDAG